MAAEHSLELDLDLEFAYTVQWTADPGGYPNINPTQQQPRAGRNRAARHYLKKGMYLVRLIGTVPTQTQLKVGYDNARPDRLVETLKPGDLTATPTPVFSDGQTYLFMWTGTNPGDFEIYTEVIKTSEPYNPENSP